MKKMKKISKLICLMLVISMIFATFNAVLAADDPVLTINITNVEEPVADEVPSFNYNANYVKATGTGVEKFDFIKWDEFNENYSAILEILNSDNPEALDDLVTKRAFNYDNSLGMTTQIPSEHQLNYFESNKTYIATFSGTFYTPKSVLKNEELLPVVQSTVNGKTENVKTIVLTGVKDEIKGDDDTSLFQVSVFAVYDTTVVEPEPVEIPKTDIKATVDWVNTAEKNIPNSIVLKLMNGETVVREQTVTKANAVDSDTWEYTFKDVPEEDEEGNKFAYTLAYAEANKNDLRFFNTAVKDFTIENTFIDPEIKSNVKMTSIVDREENNVKYKITFNSSIKKYSGDAEVVLTTTLPFAIDETKSKIDGGTYDAKTRSIVWKETITNIKNERDYKMIKNIDIYPTAVLPYAIEAKTVGEVKLTAVADYSESVDTVDTIESTNGNPKTGDINLTRYSTIGLIGVVAIGMAITIKRKYSTRKSKVQY